MALSPVYAAILQDLNKAVSQSQPEDVLQFCANWFNAKLEEQRVAGRLSIAQAEGLHHLHGQSHGAGPITSQRSKSLAPTSTSTFPPQQYQPYAHHQHQHQHQQPPPPLPSSVGANNSNMKKKSIPSLSGAGYSFGASSGNGSPSGHPSPFSEAPPAASGRGVPPSSSSSRGPVAGTGTESPSTGGIMWNRPFPAMHSTSATSSSGGGGGPISRDVDMHHDPSGAGPLDDDDNERDAMMRSDGNRIDRHGAISPSSRGGPSGSLSSSAAAAAAAAAAADNGIPQGYNLGRRTSVSAESIDPSTLSSSSHPLPKVVIPKTPSQRARIESSTEKNLLFRNLDEEQHNDVVNAMKEVHVTNGTEVIVQGAVGDFFYVVESGEFQIWVKPQSSSGMVVSPTVGSAANASSSASSAANANANANAGSRARSLSVEPEGSMKDDLQSIVKTEDGSTVRSDGSKLVATISSGGSFGELALMYNAPRAATVICNSENATLWALDRITFRTILMEHTSKKRRMYETFLSEVPILISLENHERSKIADALEERLYEEGEDVVREGELGKNFYIIESGKAEVLKRKDGNNLERVGTLTKGDYFGELALLNSAPRAATVRAVSGRLRVATLGEKAFTRLLGPVVEILTRSAVTKYGAQSVNSSERERGGAPNTPGTTSMPGTGRDGINPKEKDSYTTRNHERNGSNTPTTGRD